MTATSVRPEDCLARTAGEVEVRGLLAPVRIVRDRWGIPHIRASSVADAFFGQGYAIGQDRMFQLELRRRQARGTTAAFINKGFLAQDRSNRRTGFQRLAEQEWEAQSAESRLVLEAHAAGVNAAIETQPRPYEFELLGHSMAPWSPVDTLAIMKMVALGNQWAPRIRRAKLLAAHGVDAVLNSLPDHIPGMALITPSGARWESEVHPLRAALEQGLEEPEGPVAAGGGSNCWVLAPSRTTTGAAIVCGDPHLNIRIPAEWHLMHMECPEFTVAGPCTPGAPGPIYYGHNRWVAWTMTHANGDRWDVYREKVRRGPEGPEYLYRGEWLPFVSRREVFEVKGEPAFSETVWETRHGFVVMGDPERDEEVLAARWALFEPGHDFDGLLALHRSRSAAEARQGLRLYDSISGNFCFADVEGNIGYQYTGRVPKRPPYLVPVPGWDGEHEWGGWVAKDELPCEDNPRNGFIATANNKTTTPDYPYYLSPGGAPWRADRLHEILQSRERFSPADMPAIQGDLLSPVARELVARYTSFEARDADARRMQEILRRWDCVVGVESREAPVYMETSQQLMDLTVNRLYEADNTNAETPAQDRRNILFRMLRLGDRSLLGEFESWEAAIEAALKRAAAALRERFGPDESRWRWGDAHWMTWRHNLGRDPELAPVFNLPDTPVGGDGATLWATQARFGRGSDHGVSYRQIFDLSDLNAARVLMPPGNSGQPGSPHYGDNISRWLSLDYHPLYVEWPDIEAHAEAEMELRPAKGS
ncbi:MAG TPA: penicillin acylase family protein [Dehalococcoidia bacterium]|nr:penicillin acylase family protein [Dehalococcoidia bacterium]